MPVSSIGVCSWSLRPATPRDLIAALERLQLRTCQLALMSLVDRPEVWGGAITDLRAAGIDVVSGMLGMKDEDYSTLETIRRTGGVALDARWEENLERCRLAALLASEHGIPLVTCHAGFLPHDRHDPRRAVLLDRLRRVSETFAGHGVDLAFETGQETAETLLDALDDLHQPNVGVNFDPANMILYGMGDPVAAFRQLLPRVKQVHIKDALPTRTPGEWGSEVPAGHGAVDWPAFFAVARSAERPFHFIIEREAGETREADIAAAVELLRTHR